MLVKSRKNVILPSFVDGFFGNDFLEGFTNTETHQSNPAVNIAENEKEFKVEIAFPGVKKEDFELDVVENVLTVSVKKGKEKVEKKEDSNLVYSKKEFSFVSFSKQFTLPETADIASITAEHNNGILYVTIPKKEEVKIEPKKISVN